jgi:hypothetical protein
MASFNGSTYRFLIIKDNEKTSFKTTSGVKFYTSVGKITINFEYFNSCENVSFEEAHAIILLSDDKECSWYNKCPKSIPLVIISENKTDPDTTCKHFDMSETSDKPIVYLLRKITCVDDLNFKKRTFSTMNY